MSLHHVLQSLEYIANTASTKEKEKIFMSALQDPEFRTVCYFALHPHKQFHVLKIQLNSNPDHYDHINDEIFRYLDFLSSKSGANNQEVKQLEDLASVDEETFEVVDRIINKDLKCGISIRTAAKHMEDITEYPVMLCTAQNEKASKRIKDPCYSDLKEDGGYISIECVDGNVEYKSRDGRIIHIGKGKVFFADMADTYGDNCVYVGEALFLDEKMEKFLSRKKSNGLLNKGIKGTISDDEISRMRFRLWDMIDYDDFLKGKSDVPLIKRRSFLEESLRLIDSDSENAHSLISHCKYKICANQEERDAHYSELVALGHEGTIEKNMDSPWEAKRSPNFVKRKGEHDCDLEIIGFNPHKKKPHLTGSFICASSDRKLIVGVGSGLNDDTRAMNPHDLLGCIVEVRFNEIIQSDSKDTYSLFLPRFDDKGDRDWIREDKSTAHTIEEIMSIQEKDNKKSKE